MKKYEFDAVIKKADKGGSYIEFPYDAVKEFGKGRVKVIVYFDGIEYRGSLVKMGGSCHIVGLLKEIKVKIGKDVSDTVSVALEEDKEERIVEVHQLLEHELDKDKALKDIYEKLSYTKKKEINKLLFGSKKHDTQIKNLEKIIAEINGKK